MKEVLPGIFQMTLTLSGFNPGSINVYLLKDGTGYTIVDTGWDTPVSIKSMQEQLAEFNIRFTDIKRVIITHCHIDHLGMAGRFKLSHNATIYLHKNELYLIGIRFSNGDQFIPLTDKFLQTHGFPKDELTPPEVQIPNVPHLVAPDVLLQGGEIIPVGEYRLKVINTPGHTPGHISLYEPAGKFLLSGDVLLPTIATNAALHVQHIQNPLQQYINSLQVLKELDIDRVLPGHEHIFSNHRQRIDELLKHHQQKREEILQAFPTGEARTAFDISRTLSSASKGRSVTWGDLSGWDKRFAVLQTIAHLEEMASAGLLIKFMFEGKNYYRKT